MRPLQDIYDALKLTMLTLVYLFSHLTWAAHCKNISQAETGVESKFEQSLQTSISKLGFRTILDESKVEKILILHPTTKDEIGFVTYTYRARNKELIIKWIYIGDEVYKKKGLSYVLIGRLLQLFPETRTISTAQLARDNLKSLEEQLENRSLLQALKETPFYKALHYYGYSNIDPWSITSQYGFGADKVDP